MKHALRTILLALIVILFACEREDVNLDPNARLQFSVDTLSFDTVFTTVGSVTLNFRIYNPYNKDLEISEVALSGGELSPFRINVDGYDGGIDQKVTDVIIRAKDSMYVFVEATLDANNGNLPLIITDSLSFITNGNQQFVQLVAYGQDVHHLNVENAERTIDIRLNDVVTKAILLNTTELTNDKPYLVEDHIVVDSLETLTLNEGVILYLEKNVSIFVKGTFKVKGTLDNPVQIRGARLDELFEGLPYEKVPGQWGYIHLLAGSKDNEIDNARIRNGIIGIQVDSVVTQNKPTLKISNSVIQNMTAAGIYGLGSVIEASNCVISNCGQFNVYLGIGGSYSFLQCTIGNYYTWGRDKTPAVVLKNYYESADKQIVARDLKRADFINSIIYGTLQTEVALVNTFDYEPVDAEFNYLFDYCIIKGKTDLDTLDGTHFRHVMWDRDPMFVSPSENFDFSLDSLSPAVNAGNAEFLTEDTEYDIFGNYRLKDEAPDLGAIEFVPKSKKE
ncbi:right-handed parallel beta-helix repeat-containing protein [Saccharicrinis sp. FJH54]|uniref:right-handed parallel beta-helix repeat-containing protein n=1 Tax=Saccharicrinis sp. FJH54 TaxID=3344665 RepID=UPI0035D4700F